MSRNEEEERNWAELDKDLLSLIFNKVGAIDILLSAQYVCKPWRNLSFDPLIWKVVDMTTLHGDPVDFDLEKMAREAVDRSQGGMEAFWIEYFGSDDLLRYVADRTRILKCLRLISAYDISDEGLCVALERLTQLEELDITFAAYSDEICKNIGKACPNLKCFRFNKQGSRYHPFEHDEEAFEIANNMSELRSLQIIGNNLTSKGLTEIVDKCIHLEHLDIRCCFSVKLDAEIRAKCARIKDLRLPDDPTDDYDFIAEGSDDEFYPSGCSDVDMYDDISYDDYLSYDDYTSYNGYDIFDDSDFNFYFGEWAT